MDDNSSVQARPSWDGYFLALAVVASTRSTCLRRQIGAVFASKNRILATGYNGSPSGTAHCTDIGCLRQQLGIPSGERHEICRGAHAEMNAIAQAASSGVSLRGSTVYCTHEPCSICGKLLINSDVASVVYIYSYPDELSRTLLSEARIPCVRYGRPDEIRSVLERALAFENMSH